MVDLLVFVVVALIIGGLVFYLIDLIPLPHPFGMAAKAVLVILLIVLILGWVYPQVGGFSLRRA